MGVYKYKRHILSIFTPPSVKNECEFCGCRCRADPRFPTIIICPWCGDKYLQELKNKDKQ